MSEQNDSMSRRQFLSTTGKILTGAAVVVALPPEVKAQAPATRPASRSANTQAEKSPVKILCIPYTSVEKDTTANVAGVLEIIDAEMAKERADLVVLPELFTCGYAAPNLAPYAEPLKGPSFAKFKACSEKWDVLLGYGFAECSGGDRVYNSWALLEPGKEPHVYRKTHLHPAAAGSPVNEPEFLLAGDKLEPFATRLGTLGVMICYDGCFVEVPRALALQGAEIILWPTRSGSYLASRGYARMRSLDNVVPIVQVEGGQKGSYFPMTSWSAVAIEGGKEIRSQKDSDAPFRVEIDLAGGRRLRAATDAGALCLYRPRRPELYGSITRVP
ncbi:MAG: carbon-nitrogen hydrolase family protein [Phycisphaerae bacterium]|jgi:predicted amidohydrolase